MKKKLESYCSSWKSWTWTQEVPLLFSEQVLCAMNDLMMRSPWRFNIPPTSSHETKSINHLRFANRRVCYPFIAVIPAVDHCWNPQWLTQHLFMNSYEKVDVCVDVTFVPVCVCICTPGAGPASSRESTLSQSILFFPQPFLLLSLNSVTPFLVSLQPSWRRKSAAQT